MKIWKDIFINFEQVISLSFLIYKISTVTCNINIKSICSILVSKAQLDLSGLDFVIGPVAFDRAATPIENVGFCKGSFVVLMWMQIFSSFQINMISYDAKYIAPYMKQIHKLTKISTSHHLYSFLYWTPESVCRPDRLWGSTNLLSNGYRGLFPRE
jgi:hypothetical protein